MKAMKKKPVFPDPKRGKRRVGLPQTRNTHLWPMFVMVFPPRRTEAIARWGRSIQEWMSLSPSKLLQKLLKDKILSWKGKHCPRCGKGVMGPLKFFKDKKLWAHRCNHRYCHKLLQPHDFHPVFFMSSGKSSTPLSKQVAALIAQWLACLASRLTWLDMDHKPVERIYANLDVARADYVTKQEVGEEHHLRWRLAGHRGR